MSSCDLKSYDSNHLSSNQSFLPVSERVFILPCTHRIEESIAKVFFERALVTGWETSKKFSCLVLCPVCKKLTDNYSVDNAMCAIADKILVADDDEIFTTGNVELDHMPFCLKEQKEKNKRKMALKYENRIL